MFQVGDRVVLIRDISNLGGLAKGARGRIAYLEQSHAHLIAVSFYHFDSILVWVEIADLVNEAFYDANNALRHVTHPCVDRIRGHLDEAAERNKKAALDKAYRRGMLHGVLWFVFGGIANLVLTGLYRHFFGG